jgi:high affinity Mn2+ porin
LKFSPCFQASLILLFWFPVIACAQEAPEAPPPPSWNLHYQVTFFPMYHGTFPEDYPGNPGTGSLIDSPELDASLTSTLFGGVRLWKDGAFYLDPELAAGLGFSNVTGIAGFPNGEIYRVSSATPKVKMVRAYLKQVFGLGGEQETITEGENQLAEKIDVSRITLVAGKFSLPDFFDQNTYNGDARNQFTNWAMWSTGAWDYPGDTEGYTEGVMLELNQRDWAFRLSGVLTATTANGDTMDLNIAHAHGSVAELEYRYNAGTHPGKIRLAGFINSTLQGLYSQAVAEAAGTGNLPVMDNSAYHDKAGGYLDAEQELGQDLGIFARVGLQNGNVETWAFAAIDQSVQAGFLLSGNRWGRPDDQFGLGYVVNGLGAQHIAYLEEGGVDFIIGDGQLNYAPEGILETYYNFHPIHEIGLTLDFQWVTNPAYNQDRGPVGIVGGRCHFEI